MSLRRITLVFGMVLTAAPVLRGQSPSPNIPDTEAGRVFQQWVNAYNAADSVALIEYARQHEPEMNIALNLQGRGVSGGVDVQSIERSDPRHLELVLKTRRTALTVYAVVDVDGGRPARASTGLSIVGETFDRAILQRGYEGTVLDGNVGYVKFSNFRDPQECGENASAAMSAIAGTRAVIIDLRDNGGGMPQMVAYLASYLFARRTHLNDSYTRISGTTEEWRTRDDVAGPKFGETKPAYVLTSTLTISAAEEFAYDLQALKRATIVGETSAGAAHMTGSGTIGPHLMIAIPIARQINPVTKTDWEGTGVIPDVRAPASEALSTALRLIRERK